MDRSSWPLAFLLRRKPDPRPDGWVLAEAYDPGFDEGDCSYHSLISASDGLIYFTVSTRLSDHHARFCCFNPGSQKMAFVKDIGEAIAPLPGDLPHGKVHVPLFEVDRHILLATHVGYSQPDRASGASYPGFHVVSYDLSAGHMVDLIQGPSREGLISAVLDAKRMIYYGLTWPSGLLIRCALVQRDLQVSSPPCVSDPKKSTRGESVCRSLGLDDQGFVYGSCVSGSIWRCAAEGKPEFIQGVNGLDGALAPIDRKGRSRNDWREVIWDEVDHCFYGIHAGTNSLFRFQPQQKTIEPLARFGAGADRKRGHAPYGAQLGLAIGQDRVIYHLAHGPPVGRGNRMRRSVYLVSYDLELSRVTDHGPVSLESGRHVMFAESLAMDTPGNLYSVAWVEISDPDKVERFRGLRRMASNQEARGEAYQMMLLRIAH